MMNTDTDIKQSIQSQAESDDQTPKTNQQDNMSSHNITEMQ